MIKDLNITMSDFKVAIMALNHRNYRQCIEKEEGDFIYAYLTQYNLNRENGKVKKDALKPLLTSLPSEEVLDAQMQYALLPPSKKKYFENTIGTNPFDIIKVSLPVFNYFRSRKN